MNILGLHDGHGASISILIDGEVVAAYEEERFSRLKGDSGFPLKASTQLKKDYSDTLDFSKAGTYLKEALNKK